MADRYKVAIIGSGPGGISAAARASAIGMSHILLERQDHYSDTIYKYQKGKLVMATPEILPLRSDLEFAQGSREQILNRWDEQLAAGKINSRFKTEVVKVEGQKGNFTITTNTGETFEAENVVLAIGCQGNLRKMGVPGEEWERVQYQLDDPDAYEDETIMVVGAGDSAIENAVALSKQNKVIIVNRRGEFARAKTGNITLITKAIESGTLECVWNAAPVRVDPGKIVLKTPQGEAAYDVSRVIARLGGDPPRRFVESCGVKFASKDPGAFPPVSPIYESNTQGLFVIGALAGYPLIKHCMNQGYEVIEFINGNMIKPADEPLLEEKFAQLPGRLTVDQAILGIKDGVRLFNDLTTLQLREFMLDTIFANNDYGDSLFSILDGQVDIEVVPGDQSRNVTLGEGEFFGEVGLIAGRRRSATVKAKSACVLIETPRKSAVKLINSIPAAKRVMDEVAIIRQLKTYLSQDLTEEDLKDLVASATVETFESGQKLMEEGGTDDNLFIIRSGSVTVSRKLAGRDVVMSYVPAGRYVGEMGLLRHMPRMATVAAAIETEAIKVAAAPFRALMDSKPALKEQIHSRMQERILESVQAESDTQHGNVMSFLIGQGIGEATDVLLIDESLCVRCDNCEKACAEAHEGISRLNREAGPTYAMIHVPTSCRHCEHPHCMEDCPPDAIHRAPNGEVFISEACIGCGNCTRNCPYGVIQLAEHPPEKPGILQWLLLGRGPGPGEDKEARRKQAMGEHHGVKHAVKCDMCKDIEGGAACVRACPTGAAIRVSPEEFFQITSRFS
jgi:thioredoxin reductase/CRP-like cAMP-binding protein/Fe-S-cluster-containing hydrogenase component 2